MKLSCLTEKLSQHKIMLQELQAKVKELTSTITSMEKEKVDSSADITIFREKLAELEKKRADELKKVASLDDRRKELGS